MKALDETPNVSLQRKNKFDSISDYIVTMLYGTLREREFIKWDVDSLLGLMKCKPVPESCMGNGFLFSKYLVHFSEVDRAKVNRTIGPGDQFLVRIGTGKETAESSLWSCECIQNQSNDGSYVLSGLLTHTQGDIRPVCGSECTPRKDKMLVSVQIQVTELSKTLEAKINSLNAFQELLTHPAARTKQTKPEQEAKELERLLKGKEFHEQLGHRFFDALHSEKREQVSKITRTMNVDQKEALQHVWDARDKFAIVTTPSGTGKIEFVLNVVRVFQIVSKQILLVTATDSFANGVATRIKATLPHATTIRLNGLYEEVFGTSEGHWEELHSMPRRNLGATGKDYFRQKAYNLTLREKLFFAARADRSILTDATKQKHVAARSLRLSNFVITTFSVATEAFLHESLKPDAIIICQAAYVPEMDVFPVLFGTRMSAKLALLVGDECQSTPVVHSRARYQQSDG